MAITNPTLTDSSELGGAYGVDVAPIGCLSHVTFSPHPAAALITCRARFRFYAPEIAPKRGWWSVGFPAR
jgi:hypothetical protein